LFVTPLTLTDCSVTIGSTTDVGPQRGGAGLRLRAQPNPFRGAVQLSVESDAPGELGLVVVDMQGRTIRRLPDVWVAGSTRSIEWDGKDESGVPAPAGIYLVLARMGDRVRQTRVTLLW
jgi:flagellar hook assembly protein FlgD